MSQFPVDVDAEAIFLDGAWYTREDLSRRVRAMLDQGDFNVARPSLALQELTQVMQGIRTLAFRSTPQLAEQLSEYANRNQLSVGAVIRDAVAQFMASGPREQAPIALDTTVSSQNLPKVVVEPEPAPAAAGGAPIAGPGALRAAGVEPAKNAEQPERSESGWFKQ
jgi:hypothetical protein